MEAKQTPLIDLLESVPRDAVLIVEHDQFSSSSHPVGRLCHEAAAALRAARKVVAWARPLYATEPAEAWEPGDVIDVEFHNRPEKPEGEGWRPLVFADTGDEALLKQALEALEYASDLTKLDGLQGCECPICTTIAALRERLGEKA